MSALDELVKSPMLTRTQLEWAILVTLEHGGEATAAWAAQELEMMRSELDLLRRLCYAAENVIQGNALFGYPSPADMKKLEEALSKCRAA